MPCDNSFHAHAPWPKTGAQRFKIESCETNCGWCEHTSTKANNLRVHAHRHVKETEHLSSIVIVPCKAGRRRVSTNFSSNITLPRDSVLMVGPQLLAENTALPSRIDPLEEGDVLKIKEELDEATGRIKLLTLKVTSLHEVLSAMDRSTYSIISMSPQRLYDVRNACRLRPEDTQQIPLSYMNKFEFRTSYSYLGDMLDALQALQGLSGKEINESVYFSVKDIPRKPITSANNSSSASDFTPPNAEFTIPLPLHAIGTSTAGISLVGEVSSTGSLPFQQITQDKIQKTSKLLHVQSNPSRPLERGNHESPISATISTDSGVPGRSSLSDHSDFTTNTDTGSVQLEAPVEGFTIVPTDFESQKARLTLERFILHCESRGGLWVLKQIKYLHGLHSHRLLKGKKIANKTHYHLSSSAICNGHHLVDFFENFDQQGVIAGDYNLLQEIIHALSPN